MGKRIVILDRLDPAELKFRYLLWADVPASRQAFYADPAKSSAYAGASASELSALRSGAVAEKTETVSFEKTAGIPEVKAGLEQAWQEFQAAVSGKNLWSQYGTFWDGTVWTQGGVA